MAVPEQFAPPGPEDNPLTSVIVDGKLNHGLPPRQEVESSRSRDSGQAIRNEAISISTLVPTEALLDPTSDEGLQLLGGGIADSSAGFFRRWHNFSS